MFIHLRNHSSYSLGFGALRFSEMIEYAKEQQMPAIGLSDSNNLFGSLEFALATSGAGIQPIIGCNITITENKGDMPRADLGNHPDYGDLLLITKTEQGFLNLLELVGQAYLDGRECPVIHTERLVEFNQGLICLSGNMDGLLGKYCLSGNRQKGGDLLEFLQNTYQQDFFIELQRHSLPQEEALEQIFLDYAVKKDIPIVASNGCLFKDRGGYAAHDAFICIAEGRYVTEENRRKYNEEFFLKTPAQMKELFKDLPEAIENTILIARKCHFMPQMAKPMLPSFMPQNFLTHKTHKTHKTHNTGGNPLKGKRPSEKQAPQVLSVTSVAQSENEEFENQAKQGLSERLRHLKATIGIAEEYTEKDYQDRLEFEIKIINKMNYAGYFLIVSDFIKYAKQQNIPVGPGRGSGAGSLVAYSLKITDLDPIRYGLIFERFLNPDRVSMPDFDIDFCQEKRDEVISYVQQKYGKETVAQIITFGKLQARAVLRDVGRVLQMPYGKVDRISKMVPFNPVAPVTLAEAIKMDDNLRQQQKEDEEIANLLNIGLKLEGLHRHISTHAAGIVIAPGDLKKYIPIYKDPSSEMPITGYSMKYTELAGLVKFDFLGLKTLTLINKAVGLVNCCNTGDELDISLIPLDDKNTFDMLSRGETIGVFQMESAGMREAIKNLKPDKLEDIIALISLYRPGPMENIPTYIKCKHGKQAIEYPHAILEPVLQETFGVIIYQEQVMKIAQILAGYTLAQADLLRRAMGKKVKAEMDAQREIFIKGAVANNIEKQKAGEIFDLVAKFAGYGFNKSHAAAYALIGYQTAYLKANHPVEFLVASMNMDIGDTDKLAVLIYESKQMGVEIMPPHVNVSGAFFEVHEISGIKKISYALGALKNVGIEVMKELTAERQANGKFKDITDFACRLSIKVMNKRLLESLIKAGAMDGIINIKATRKTAKNNDGAETTIPNRNAYFQYVNNLIEFSKAKNEEKANNQVSLFGGGGSNKDEFRLPKIHPEWSMQEKLAGEFEAIGIYLNNHPIEPIYPCFKQLGLTSIADVNARMLLNENGSFAIEIAGMVTKITHRSSNGRRFSYINVTDPTGRIEVNLFNEELISNSRNMLVDNKPLYIKADLRKDDNGARIIADYIGYLQDFLMERKITRVINLNIDDDPAKISQYKTAQYSDNYGGNNHNNDATETSNQASAGLSCYGNIIFNISDGKHNIKINTKDRVKIN